MVRIDFIAGHELLTQGAESVYAALRDRAECRWHIGRPIKPTGADAAVFIDHIHHHPDFAAWKYRFYLLHDLGDIDVYTKERQALHQFTMVITPDEVHAAQARRHLVPRWWRSGTTVSVGGWPKYDAAALPLTHPDVAAEIMRLPRQPSLLYAISWAGEAEWQELFPLLMKLPLNVIIKNHPYATAPGQEISDYYQRSRQSAAAMEAFGRARGYSIAPADLNVCTLFPYVDAVISDQSSVLAEFLPWGPSFETGTNPAGPPQPGVSQWYPGVTFWPLPALLDDLRRGGRQLLGAIAQAKPAAQPPRGAGEKIADMIWDELCRSGTPE